MNMTKEAPRNTRKSASKPANRPVGAAVSASPGDPRPDFLTVATYPLGTNALTALRKAGREDGAQTVELPGGSLMVTKPAHPTSAYYVRPGWRFEVEVYHPTAGEAMRLVLTEAVQEIR